MINVFLFSLVKSLSYLPFRIIDCLPLVLSLVGQHLHALFSYLKRKTMFRSYNSRFKTPPSMLGYIFLNLSLKSLFQHVKLTGINIFLSCKSQINSTTNCVNLNTNKLNILLLVLIQSNHRVSF